MMLTFIIFSLPWLIELAVETYYEKVKKVSVNHFWSAVVRGLLMLTIALIVGKWEALVLMVALHFMFFDYSYNLITGRKLSYTRDGGIDRLWEQIGWLATAFFRIIILITGIQVYFKLWL